MKTKVTTYSASPLTDFIQTPGTVNAETSHNCIQWAKKNDISRHDRSPSDPVLSREKFRKRFHGSLAYYPFMPSVRPRAHHAIPSHNPSFHDQRHLASPTRPHSLLIAAWPSPKQPSYTTTVLIKFISINHQTLEGNHRTFNLSY